MSSPYPWGLTPLSELCGEADCLVEYQPTGRTDRSFILRHQGDVYLLDPLVLPEGEEMIDAIRFALRIGHEMPDRLN
jgi:hypothetical protein